MYFIIIIIISKNAQSPICEQRQPRACDAISFISHQGEISVFEFQRPVMDWTRRFSVTLKKGERERERQT